MDLTLDGGEKTRWELGLPACLPGQCSMPTLVPCPHMTIIVKYDVNQPNKSTLYTWTDVQEELDLPAWSMLYANPAQDT